MTDRDEETTGLHTPQAKHDRAIMLLQQCVALLDEVRQIVEPHAIRVTACEAAIVDHERRLEALEGKAA